MEISTCWCEQTWFIQEYYFAVICSMNRILDVILTSKVSSYSFVNVQKKNIYFFVK